jgi:hypothetical protein
MSSVTTENPTESRDAVVAAWDTLREHTAKMGVPSIEALMDQVEAAVLKMHGPVPPTPTWEDVVADWAEHQQLALEAARPTVEGILSEILEAEVVPDPVASLPAVSAAAKALPPAPVKASAKARRQASRTAARR